MTGAANDNATPGSTALTGRPCPICGKPATVASRPFCSKRCADVDLHRWLGGAYRVPTEDRDRDESPDPAEP